MAETGELYEMNELLEPVPARQPEVEHLHELCATPRLAEVDVRGLEVAMQDAVLVDDHHSGRHLPKDLDAASELDGTLP
jgi:hypothetical protein